MKSSPSPVRLYAEPGSLLFLLSGLLACASVAHWLIMAFSPDTVQRHVYHMISTVQAFLTCLAAAFSFIWLQKNEEKYPAHTIKFILIVVASVATAVTAWFRYAVPRGIMLGISELCWLVLVLIIAGSAFPRLSKLRKEISLNSRFVWLPTALVFGITGAVLVSTYSSIFIMTGNNIRWLVLMGRGYLLQCMFLAVIIAFAPIVFRQVPGPSMTGCHRISNGKTFHIICALLLAISIPLELWVSYEAGMYMRALLTYLTIIHTCCLWTLPVQNSPLAWCVRVSAWLLPAGYTVAALSPAYRLIGLHIVFIGGFTLGPLSLALSWIIEKEEVLQQRFDRFLPVGLFSGFLVLSILFRVMSEATVQARVFSWGYSTMAYILGVLVWIYLLTRALLFRRDS